MEPGWRNNSSMTAVGEVSPNQCNLSQNSNSNRKTVKLLLERGLWVERIAYAKTLRQREEGRGGG